MKHRPDEIDKTNERAAFLEGMAALTADAPTKGRLNECAQDLRRLAQHSCGQGYICNGGHDCKSDHK